VNDALKTTIDVDVRIIASHATHFDPQPDDPTTMMCEFVVEELWMDRHPLDPVFAIPRVQIYLNGPEGDVYLTMEPKHARQLAEAILASGIVYSERN
jgi:hypothetical protein